MTDEPFYSPNSKPRPPRQPTPVVLLFEFRRDDGAAMSCELRDHGEFGVEAMFRRQGELYVWRTFRDEPGLGFRGRAPAITSAHRQQQAMERPR